MTQFIEWDDAFTFLESSSVDIDATAIADAASLTSDELSLDGYAGAEFGVASVEDDTGACDGNVVVYILGYGATGWETVDDAPQIGAVLAQDQNTTRRAQFSVDASQYSAVKLLVDNDCGQAVAVSIKYKRSQFGSS